MDSTLRKQLKALLHPYLFILKEGGEIQADLLDYSLLMLQVDCADRLKSPKIQQLTPPSETQESLLPTETLSSPTMVIHPHGPESTPKI